MRRRREGLDPGGISPQPACRFRLASPATASPLVSVRLISLTEQSPDREIVIWKASQLANLSDCLAQAPAAVESRPPRRTIHQPIRRSKTPRAGRDSRSRSSRVPDARVDRSEPFTGGIPRRSRTTSAPVGRAWASADLALVAGEAGDAGVASARGPGAGARCRGCRCSPAARCLRWRRVKRLRIFSVRRSCRWRPFRTSSPRLGPASGTRGRPSTSGWDFSRSTNPSSRSARAFGAPPSSS